MGGLSHRMWRWWWNGYFHDNKTEFLVVFVFVGKCDNCGGGGSCLFFIILLHHICICVCISICICWNVWRRWWKSGLLCIISPFAPQLQFHRALGRSLIAKSFPVYTFCFNVYVLYVVFAIVFVLKEHDLSHSMTMTMKTHKLFMHISAIGGGGQCLFWAILG